PDRAGCEMRAVVITAGSGQRFVDGAWHVPKMDLLAGMRAALEQGRLRISRGMREAEALVRELGEVRVGMRRNGRMRVGAAANRAHDDLVLAVALACWEAAPEFCGAKPGKPASVVRRERTERLLPPCAAT